MQGWLDMYREPLFWLFPIGTTLVSVLAFALFATPLTLLALRDPEWARPYRVQERRPDPARVIWPSIVSWLQNNAIMTTLAVAAWPLFRQTGVHYGGLPPASEVALHFLVFVFVDDFLFYWMHRALHHPWLFKHVHRKHHLMVTPWAVTGHYMHPLEFCLIGFLALLGPLALGSHVVTIWIWIAWRQWEAAEGHCGYSFPWSPSKLFGPFYDGVEYHDFHHAKFNGNYAGFLSYLDGIFGEYAKGYREYLAAKRG